MSLIMKEPSDMVAVLKIGLVLFQARHFSSRVWKKEKYKTRFQDLTFKNNSQ